MATAQEGVIICGMVRNTTLAFLLLVAIAAPLAAQAPDAAAPETVAPETVAPAPPRSMTGSWEFSNADREKTCTITFRNDAAKVGKRVEFDSGCAKLFPFIREIVGWRLGDNDFLRLLDAQGNSVLEFSEVESGIFEAPKPGEGILFVQNPTDLGPAPKTAEQMTGEWTIVRRTGQRVCGLTLSDTAAGEEFVVRLQHPCDQVVTRFAPATWQMDRGEIVLRAANGQAWRFEEGEDARWQRVPQSASPLLMVRK
jgi:protease inhibitor Inh